MNLVGPGTNVSGGIANLICYLDVKMHLDQLDYDPLPVP
jgi:hypothetical protein